MSRKQSSSVRPPRARAAAFAFAFAFAAAAAAPAQWSPAAGQWGRIAPSDVRVMTWNVRDTICSTNTKTSTTNDWAAVARVVAAFRPDVLLLQECGDNNGNGTGSTVDTVANLTTTLGLLLHGGPDPFKPGSPAVAAYVQLFAPGFDLPYAYVATVNDGFNRNVILSRWPFADQNGDGRATLDDVPTITADLYAPGGQGGIRGFQTVEIDLPNAGYAGDLVVGNCHLKASSGTSNHNQRVDAAKDVAYFIDYFYNGAGGAVPDPRGKIADAPPATSVLGPNTPVVVGGDWNEDEAQNGTTIGPADWMTRAQTFDAAGGTDGPDRNRTDMTYDSAVDPFTLAEATTGTARFDYLAWQDSLATPRAQFVFNAANVTPATALPPEIATWPGSIATFSTTASDHRPVIVDLALPAALGCNSAGTDLGFASLGTGGVYPRFALCGSAGSGGAVAASLSAAAPNAAAFLGVSGAAGMTSGFGGTIVPVAPLLVGPFTTDAAGQVSFGFPGGGGPLTVVAQWAVLDAVAPSGVAFSNAEALLLLP